MSTTAIGMKIRFIPTPFYLYEDHILIRTYDHTRGEWLPAFDRTVTLPEWCCLTA